MELMLRSSGKKAQVGLVKLSCTVLLFRIRLLFGTKECARKILLDGNVNILHDTRLDMFAEFDMK